MNTSTRSAETLKTLCLGLSYVFSYAYISLFASSYPALGITIFLTLLSLGAILWLELSIRQQTLLGRFSPSKIQKVETRFWEVILILLSISTYRGGQVVALSFFFVHAVVIYMVLVGTGHLLSDRSSCLMPMDLLNGGFRLTFGNIILRIVSLFNLITHRYEMPAEASPAYAEAVSSATSPDSSDSAVPASYPYPVTNPERKNPGRVLAILGVLFLIFLFFVAAVNNLARVDGHFNDALLSIDKFLANISVSTAMLKFFFSIPVGAFLFGLFQGSVEKDIQKEKDFREKIVSSSGKFRFMPDTLFCVVLSVFIAVYLAFYISQASYMFSAFAGVLPEEFTASEYAVSGFHELINVVLINFILLSLVRIFGSHEHKLLRSFSVALMAESMVFAAISASKIILYMSRFGYTYSRTLGLWGTSVVFVGSALAIVYLLLKKNTFAPWLWYSAGSYVVMAFITWIFAAP